MNVQLENIPDELKPRPQWVTHKQNKIPLNPATGRAADTTDPTTWGTFDEACQAAQRRHHAGIGYVFSPDDPYVGIDLDDCIGDEGQIEIGAQGILATMDSYSEKSPSGTGVHIIVAGDIAKSIKTKQIEVYSQDRYFTVTGQQLAGTPSTIRSVNGELTKLCDSLRPAPRPKVETPRPQTHATPDSDHARRYACAALESEHQAMLAATDGERHNLRIKAAYALAGYIPHITEQEIFDALAVNFGDNQESAEKTIRDGIASGKNESRTIPERAQPRLDALGHACCPTHGERLIACRNGNGWRCPAPKMGEPLCFWWAGEDYTPPAEQVVDGFTILDPDELREVLRVVIAERDRYRQQVEDLETELKQVKEHNRFVTQATGADIASAGKRLTFIELKKELDRVPVEEREDGQMVRVRQTTMARNTNQNAGTISKHLKEFKAVGWIDTAVKRIYDAEADAWTSETFVRSLVDLNNTAVISLPAKPRGRRTCGKCGSDQLVREVKIRCVLCEHEEVSEPELVNPKNPEVQIEIQDDQPAEDAATFFEMLPEPVAEVLNCNAPCIGTAPVGVSELQTAIHSAGPTQPTHKQEIILPDRYKQLAAQRKAVSS